MKAFFPDETHVRCIGRTAMIGNIRWLSMSGSGIEFAVMTKKLILTLKGGEQAESGAGTGKARYAVYVNGQEYLRDLMTEREKTITIGERTLLGWIATDSSDIGERTLLGRMTADSSDIGEGSDVCGRVNHFIQPAVIRILKLSECAMSGFGIASIQVDEYSDTCEKPDFAAEGDLKDGSVPTCEKPDFTAEGDLKDGPVPTCEKPMRIEFIGDSITCGYGVEASGYSQSFTTSTEDVTKAYAYKAAELLNAEYSIFAVSGYGIVSGYSDDGTRRPEQMLPPYYESIGFSYERFGGGVYPQDISWDFMKYQPDYVVINLGTNDFNYCLYSQEGKELFYNNYISFLKLVRAHNPHAHIMCILGIMGASLYQMMEKAVTAYKEAAGDSEISITQFEEQKPENGYGADWHPSEKTHQIAAVRLAELIGQIESGKKAQVINR